MNVHEYCSNNIFENVYFLSEFFQINAFHSIATHTNTKINKQIHCIFYKLFLLFEKYVGTKQYSLLVSYDSIFLIDKIIFTSTN